MNLSSWREKMKRFDNKAEVIFDREEPVGKTTDMVLPRSRWFRRRKAQTSRTLARANA